MLFKLERAASCSASDACKGVLLQCPAACGPGFGRGNHGRFATPRLVPVRVLGQLRSSCEISTAASCGTRSTTLARVVAR